MEQKTEIFPRFDIFADCFILNEKKKYFMDLGFITELYIPMVMVVCLIVGFIMKKFMPTDNKWIPLTVTVLGGILGCVAAGCVISLEAIAGGMVTGLASTGLHQVFTQLLNIGGKKDQ